MDLPLSVRFYRLASGREPVREWLKENISVNDRKEIGADIKTVQLGWPLGMPLVRKMEAGLWEIRSTLQDGIARIFFTLKDQDMILLHGFVKKSRATPATELAVARARMKDILR